MDSFWGGVGAAAALGTLIIGLLQYRARLVGLVATIEQHEFALPSSLETGPWSILRLISRAEIDEFSTQARAELLEEVATIFPRSALERLPRIASMWSVSVENTGRLTAEAVAVKIPNGLRARISRDDNVVSEDDIESVVEVGDVRPGDRLQIVVWAGHAYSDSLRRAQVVQKSGRARVIRMDRAHPFWVWVGERWVLLIYTAIMLALMASLVITGLSVGPIPALSPDSTPAPPAPDTSR